MSSTLKNRGMCFVLSSPSGAGKTTISRKMLEIDGDLTMSISYTTRPPRPGELDGVDYFFTSKDEFRDLINDNAFLEHAEVFGHFYGTPRKFVEDNLSAGIDVIFDIDWQGTHQLKGQMHADVVGVFILPPSMAELEKRLKNRAQDADEVVAKRMKKASREISHWKEYDYVLINNDLDETMESVNRILLAERLHISRQPQLEDFVQDLLFGEE